MIEDSFRKIDEYCTAHEKSTPIRNNAYCYFAIAYQKAIAEYEENSTTAAGAKTQTTILDTLLTDENIQGYVAKSEKMLEDAEKQLLRVVTSENAKFSFWASVFASVTGAFFYSILLLLVYWIVIQDISSPFDFADPAPRTEQDGADQPANALESKPEGDSKLQSESEGRSQ